MRLSISQMEGTSTEVKVKLKEKVRLDEVEMEGTN